MNHDLYQFDISRATDADTLHGFASDIAADDQLTQAEKDRLTDQIARRFSFLNAQTIGVQKPRWN